MIPEITAAIQSVKALNDLVKASRDLRNYNELASAVAEVNGKLMEAQSAFFSIYEKQKELEKEVMDLKNWEREAERYELSQIAPGVFAYKLKAGVQPPEPSHMLCTNCYNERRKSILQLEFKNQFVERYICHHCKSEIKIRSGWEPGNDPDDYDPLTFGLGRRR